MKYHSEFYNKCDDQEQWIRLTDGCFRSCWNCYCPKEVKVYDLPKIVRNKVRFLDMNFLHAHPNPLQLINNLPNKLNNKVIKYTFLCGLDYTLLTIPILHAMKKARIGIINNKSNWSNGLAIAWNRGYNEKSEFMLICSLIKECGFKNIQVRMLCNGIVSFNECVKKLLILKQLRISIDDCWYNDQRRGSVKPIHWTDQECKLFGKLCRANNVAIMQNMYDALDYLYRIEGLK